MGDKYIRKNKERNERKEIEQLCITTKEQQGSEENYIEKVSGWNWVLGGRNDRKREGDKCRRAEERSECRPRE